jgi:hypothetical protein
LHNNVKKGPIILICVIFIIITLFSMFFIHKEHNHECKGKDCPICECIRITNQTLKWLGFKVNEYSLIILNIFPLIIKFYFTTLIISFLSLVNQKIRLNE